MLFLAQEKSVPQAQHPPNLLQRGNLTRCPFRIGGRVGGAKRNPPEKHPPASVPEPVRSASLHPPYNYTFRFFAAWRVGGFCWPSGGGPSDAAVDNGGVPEGNIFGTTQRSIPMTAIRKLKYATRGA